MKRLGFSLLLGILMLFQTTASADEGMWIPMLLEKYNIEDMQKLGFKLSAEDIYSINQSSMKDAVMIFGGGCTGELISDQGLLITNHHCGFGVIQSHSSLETDYLTDGFWAMSKKEELANPGLEVRFLIRMEDVTAAVLKDITADMTEKNRQILIDKNMNSLIEENGKDNDYELRIKPFFHGNQYFMFLNKVYKDVRLVGAPPSAIGKFGGDTDNWMWPRHTGDFSLFRIYTAPDGNPAEYSDLNVPMNPGRHFPISLKGIEPGDFTMVFGYPGSTEQYVPSYKVDMTMNVNNPVRIAMRTKILYIMKAAMESDPLIRIQYASKAARVSNGWKKWIGENRGLKRLNAVERKQNEEAEFKAWAEGGKYDGLIEIYETEYDALIPTERIMTAVVEALNGMELINLASSSRGLIQYSKNDAPEERIQTTVESLESKAKGFYKDYHQETAKAITKTLIEYYMQEIEKSYWPEIMLDIEKKGLDKSIDKMFKKSLLANEADFMDFLDGYKGKFKKLEKDPIYSLYQEFVQIYLSELSPVYNKHHTVIDSLDRIYMKAQMEFRDDKIFYPDANFTLRVGYGQVDHYFPRDAVEYLHFTTLEGIMEKDNPEIYDYDVPDKLRSLYETNDFGQYANEDGQIQVCFIATNHTTGGNSGSPVIDAEGNLIGINFDRNWEGTMSDLMYDPDMCRNISLDMRYALFIIDKFAGATHLIDEMTLVQ